MRHFFANVVIYTIVAVLLTGAALFAWMRSSQLVLTSEAIVVSRFEPADAHEFEWRELGRRSYVANCMNCHGGDGMGWDQYPPLAATFGMAAVPGGREHLIDLTLYGLTSDRWGAPMPSMGHMTDVEIAAVLNHVVSASARVANVAPPELLAPAHVAERRGRKLRPADVERERPFR
jgi:mono/diheme cytochrome c family protein